MARFFYSKFRVRERDFKIVVEGYSSVEEFYNTAEAKIAGLQYPCTFNGSQTLNTQRDLFDILDSIGSMTDEEFMAVYPTMEFKFKTLCVTTSILYSKQTVKEIDYGALGGLSIESVTIPGSVEFIDYGVFYSCTSLKTVAIEEGVQRIGENVFFGCSALNSIIIPSSVTEIGHYAFYNCSGLTSITIPNSVTSIGYSAFYNCSNLTTTIGEGWIRVSDNSAVDASTLLRDISYDIKRA